MKLFVPVIAITLLGSSAAPANAPRHAQSHARPPFHNAASEDVLYSFTGSPDGSQPMARIIRDAAGDLFGPTMGGGAQACACGAIYKLTPQGAGYSEKIIYSFGDGKDGEHPAGRFFEGKVGAYFGTTERGGAYAGGTVYKVSPKPKGTRLKTLYSFAGGSDGANPQAGVVTDNNGVLYGTTASGGGQGFCTGGCGTAYKLERNGKQYAVIHRFGGGADGATPVGPLIADASGAVFGTTEAGGIENAYCSAGCGTVFKLTPSRSGYTESILYAFQGFNDGAVPTDGLYEDKQGALYGTTSSGGVNCNGVGCGTVFKLTPNGSVYRETVLYRFAGKGDGDVPTGGLVADSAGSFYGTTSKSFGLSACNCGTVYALTPYGSTYHESVLHAFTGAPNDGDTPYAGLIIDHPTGTLYGTTIAGGAKNDGAVFRVKQ